MAFFKKTELYLPAGFPSLERTLFGGGLRMACSLLNSKRSLEERSSDLGQGQASEMDWTLHTDLWKSKISRDIKKYI